MIKKLSAVSLLILITGCDPYYSEVTEATELLINNGYHDVEYQYTAEGSRTQSIRALCNYTTTIVFAAKDIKNQPKNLAVCMKTKKIHLLSQVIN